MSRIAPEGEMTPEPTCPRCEQALSPEDTIDWDGRRVVHLDCRRPRRLSFEERALLYEYCWDHAVGECVSCARSFRPVEFLSGLLGSTDLCPQCCKDLTDGVRAHLYSCALLPEEVRRRARETRAAAQKLAKQSSQLCDTAAVLMREAEVTVAALRAAMKESTAEALRLVIRSKLRDGSLPYNDIPATIPGRPGDNSVCGACDHVVTSRTLMMIVARQASPGSAPDGPIPFHADCFELWNEERRTLKSNS
jgi:hypothetical protein